MLAGLLAIGAMASAEQYKLIFPVEPAQQGKTGVLLNYDTGDTLATAVAGPETLLFQGEVDEDMPAVVHIEGTKYMPFVLEPGTISFTAADRFAFGTMLNDQQREFLRRIQSYSQSFANAPTEQLKYALYRRYKASVDSMLTANPDNTLGYLAFFLKDDFPADAEAIQALAGQYPAVAKSQRVAKLVEQARMLAATQPGHKFVDFAVTQPDGKVARLSDYAGKGKYTLVDFWASWCGPCIRQSRVLKQLQEKYKDSGKLDIVGVAVWDKPEDTVEGIKRHGITWPNIIGAGDEVVNQYGITGVPTILLIGPDGTILSRGLQGDELVAEVQKAIGF